MSPRSQKQNEQMRLMTLDKITAAAQIIFSEYGYYGATMKLITKETGLSYGLVYHYFPSKEAIFKHLVDYALERSVAIYDQAFNIEGTAWEKIEKLSKIMIEITLTTESSRLFNIMMQAMTQGKHIPGLSKHIAGYSQLMYTKLEPIIRRGQLEGEIIQGDPRVLAATYLSLVQGLMALQEREIQKKITPEMLGNLLRKKA